MTRARFTLNSITTEMRWNRQHGQTVEQRTFNFTPTHDGSPESEAFWEATPSGSLQLGVVNEKVWPLFKIGTDYYLDFTPVEAGK